MHEEFVGLYSVPQTDEGTITTVITDVFFRLKLSLNKFRGQCYDGAGNTSGQRTVLQSAHMSQNRVQSDWYFEGHALNVTASGMLKQRRRVSTSHEAIELIKYSPPKTRYMYIPSNQEEYTR